MNLACGLVLVCDVRGVTARVLPFYSHKRTGKSGSQGSLGCKQLPCPSRFELDLLETFRLAPQPGLESEV